MPVQGGFQRYAHGCLWQWCWWLCWCRLARWFSLAGGWRVQLGLGQLLRSPGNGCTEAMFTEVVRGLLIVAAIAVPVDNLVGRHAVALAGYLRGATRHQLDITAEDEGHRLVHTAVALWQLGLGLVGDG